MSKFSQIDIKPELDSTTNPRIGLIALSTDFTIEQDYRRICHNLPLDIFVNRIPFNNPLNHENYLKMSDHLPSIAKNILPDQELNTIAYGCTSGTVAMGENLIANQIKKSKPNTYVTTPITAALKAFKKLNIKKISVLTPYPKPVNESVFNYLLKNFTCGPGKQKPVLSKRIWGNEKAYLKSDKDMNRKKELLKPVRGLFRLKR